MIAVHVQVLQQELEDIGIKEESLAKRIENEEKLVAKAISEQAELAGIEEQINQSKQLGSSIADAYQRIRVITDSGGFEAVVC